MPARPVAQLAFPELTRSARTRPPVLSNDLRPTSMGAATTRFFVNNATAAQQALAELCSAGQVRAPAPTRFAREGAFPRTSTNARSGRPLALMPAATAEKEKPRGRRIFSGELLREVRGAVMPESSASSWVAARLRTWATLRGSSVLRRSDRAGGIDNNLCGFYREDPDDSQP
jgi:hypothetical protein